MGLDRYLQGLPENAPLLATARGAGAACLAQLPWWWRELSHGRTPSSPVAESNTALQRLEWTIEQVPDLADFFHDLGRRWDMVAYLLSQGRGGERAPGAIAVEGASVLAPRATGTQGVPLRWSEPRVVRQVSGFLARLSEEELERRCDPRAMSDAGVYKVHPDQDRKALWQVLSADLTAVRRIYALCAERGYGVLVFTD